MALLQDVVFPQEHHPCGTRCASCGHDVHVVAGELKDEETRGAVLQEELVATPHVGAWDTATCCSVNCTGRPVTSPLVPAPGGHAESATVQASSGKRRRQRKSAKNREDAQSQRRNHIAVERNRRRQMNEYLAVLRSLMPPSYARRGDQASIVGGAINFVKELEQRLQSLQAQKRHAGHYCPQPGAPFAGFFTYPQYSTAVADVHDVGENRPGKRPAGVADIEAAVSEGHATVKVLALGRPRQLPMLLLGLHRRGLPVLHFSVTTTADQMVFYTFSLRIGDGCQLSSADDVAAAVFDMIADISTAEERAC